MGIHDIAAIAAEHGMEFPVSGDAIRIIRRNDLAWSNPDLIRMSEA